MALDGCVGLTQITSYAETVPTAGLYAFDGVNKSIPVYVPANTKDAYMAAAEWEEFTNYIEMPGTSGVESLDTTSATTRYFNLNGVEINEPSNGIYIKVEGNKTSKVYVK